MNTTLHVIGLALLDVHLALFWVRIKHQVMCNRLSCLFEFKSIFIHTAHENLYANTLAPKNGDELRYIKSGGGVPPASPA